MPFTPTAFQNSPSTATPITAAELDKLGTQYAQALADLRGGVDSSGDTLSKLLALLGGKVSTADAAELIRDTVAAALVAGSGMTITPNDAGDTITLAASGGGAAFPKSYSGGPAGAKVYPPGSIGNGTGTQIGGQPAGGRLVWFPYDLGACTIAGFAVNVTGAGDGAAVVKVGVYGDLGGVRPGNLLSTLGTVSATSTGMKTLSGVSYAHPGGRLWVGAVEQGHSATCAQVTTDASVHVVATTQTLNNSFSTIAQDGVTGTLPANASGESALTTHRPRIYLIIQ